MQHSTYIINEHKTKIPCVNMNLPLTQVSIDKLGSLTINKKLAKKNYKQKIIKQHQHMAIYLLFSRNYLN